MKRQQKPVKKRSKPRKHPLDKSRKRLTAKELAFVEARLTLDEDGNFTPWAEVYRQVYRVKPDASDEGCRNNAMQVAQRPHVFRALAEAEKATLRQIVGRTGDLRERLLDRLWGMVFADLTDILDYDAETGQVSIRSFKSLTPEQRALIESFEIHPGKWGQHLRVRVTKSKDLLELAGRHLGLWQKDASEQEQVQLIIEIKPPTTGTKQY